MALSDGYAAFIEERLAGLGTIRIKKMFGGAGVYCQDLFFALLDDDMLYFKADDVSRAEFEAAGLRRFVFEPKNGPPVPMSYYAAPDSVFDDDDEMRLWAGRAIAAARRAAAAKPEKGNTPRKRLTVKTAPKTTDKRARPK